jgi:cytochrome c peroxidase
MRRALLSGMIAAVALLASGSSLDASDEPRHVVGQKGKQFSTPAISVRRGEAVRFTNDDTVTHNVFSKSPNAPFNLKLQRPGQSEDVRFEQPGTAVVRCAIHPMMRLEITVEP